MSALKIVKDAQGRTVGFGPNADFYEPTVPAGGTLEYGDTAEVYVEPPPEPTPLEKIRALEAQHADDQARMTRVSLLSIAIDKGTVLLVEQMTALANATADAQELDAPARAALVAAYVAQVNEAFVHGKLMQLDSGYAAMHQLEQQIAVLRDQI